MTQPISRRLVEELYCALSERDFGLLRPYLDDNIVWSISGPIDILPFCGERRGKEVVLETLSRDVPALLAQRRFLPQQMLIEGDRAAISGRMIATLRDGGRTINYRVAQFLRFRDQKLIEYASIIDSFDAVEQVIGHSIEVNGAREPAREDSIVAI